MKTGDRRLRAGAEICATAILLVGDRLEETLDRDTVAKHIHSNSIQDLLLRLVVL